MTPSLVAALLALAGVAAAAAVVRARARREGLGVRPAVDGLFVMIAAALLIGHAADVALYRWDELARDPAAALPGSGGACTLGAVLGGGLAGLLWFRRDPAALWRHADNLTVGLTLGWGLGRLGCFATHYHLGRLTTSPLGVSTPAGPRHDLGLEEALMVLALHALLRALIYARGARACSSRRRRCSSPAPASGSRRCAPTIPLPRPDPG